MNKKNLNIDKLKASKQYEKLSNNDLKYIFGGGDDPICVYVSDTEMVCRFYEDWNSQGIC